MSGEIVEQKTHADVGDLKAGLSMTTQEVSDYELIQAHKSGDSQAFSELIDRYENRVYRHCLRMVNNKQDAEDLKQDVLLKIYRNIDSYEHAYSFYTWLYRITVNTCIDGIRKRKRKCITVSLSSDASSEYKGAEQDIPDRKVSPDKHQERMELTKSIYQAIEKLSPKLRVIIILKEINGLSYEEIADELNCSRGTVKSRLFRARVKLKEILMLYTDIEIA